MTQLMQLLKPLASLKNSSIFSLTVDGELWQLTSTSHNDDVFHLIEARILRRTYGLLTYQPELPDAVLRSMSTSARQAKVCVLVDTHALLEPEDAYIVDLRHPLVVNGATLHAQQIDLGSSYPSSFTVKKLR
ncbi:MAG: hypothetical protein Q4P66_08435 [Actinomycetaceae bacterium]|nr:hypothetical protein [Actinomycetaceae bacterium]